MSKRERHQAKTAALSALGRHLSRRARSRCELCATGEKLAPVLLRSSEDPDLDNTLLLCGRCVDVLTSKRIEDVDDLRFLDELVWSDVPLVQAAAVRMLERLDTPWARVTRENLWLSEEARAFVDGLDP